MTKENVLKALRLGLLGGLGYGLAVGIVHLAIGTGLILSLGMPPMPWFAAKSILMEVPLVVVLGLLWCPLYLSKRGNLLHPLALTVTMVALERFVAVDPSKLQMWVAPAVVGLGFYALGAWIASKKVRVTAVLAVVLPVVFLAIPIVEHKLSGGYEVSASDRGTPPPNAPDVVFIVMDTVQAQSVSAYGHDRETTPHFDAFAAEGVLFETATAPSTWSLPAHASLFTGTLPSVHNAHGETRWLDDKLPTLADTMSAAGWETRCFTANAHVSPSFGLTRGFHWSDNAWITGAGGRGFSFIYRLVDTLGATAKDKGGGQVVANIENWMTSRPADAPPAFVFVNFLEAHFPFHQLPQEFRYAYTDLPLSELRTVGQIAFGVQMGRQLTDEEFERIHQPIVDLYDGGVLYTDYLVSRVIDQWKQRGTYDDTVFVILADHGEMVGEHRAFGHVTSMYEEDLRVPFAIRYPPKIPAGSRVEPPISTLGTFATIMDLVDLEAPDTLDVGTLMPALKGEEAGIPVMAERFEEELLAARFKPGEANGEGPLVSPRGRYRSYRNGDLKLIQHYEDGQFSTHLFDLARDPGEMSDLANVGMMMVTRQDLENEVEAYAMVMGLPPLDAEIEAMAAGEAGGPPELSAAARAQLEALGYLEPEDGAEEPEEAPEAE